ncbi:MAG TPA: 7-carboxy-7-deazaguanine synthase [Smithellaceae bacterium]|nr:7-carboxy-7-deazaguanine synthase [Smithellaceae bacterium]
MYSIKEIFYSIQGEGYHAGRPAVFCRFSGCNLWSGREEHRSSSVCKFCDTDFVGTGGINGGVYRFSAELAHKISLVWPVRKSKSVRPFVVCTGGEPLLQLDQALIRDLHEEGFTIAVETNGTLPAPAGLDWICVSPKAGVELVQTSGDELKLVYPQAGVDPQQYATMDFRHFFLQPMDGVDRKEATRQTLEYVLAHPEWQISLQLHKISDVR